MLDEESRHGCGSEENRLFSEVAIDIIIRVKSLNTKYIKAIKVNLIHDNYGEASVKTVNTNM